MIQEWAWHGMTKYNATLLFRGEGNLMHENFTVLQHYIPHFVVGP